MSYVFFGGMRGTAWVNMFPDVDVPLRERLPLS